jgi:hypothetical protein
MTWVEYVWEGMARARVAEDEGVMLLTCSAVPHGTLAGSLEDRFQCRCPSFGIELFHLRLSQFTGYITHERVDCCVDDDIGFAQLVPDTILGPYNPKTTHSICNAQCRGQCVLQERTLTGIDQQDHVSWIRIAQLHR